ncbi:MAG: helix-turn-helix domain-containing protein [Clostridia bacterium]|nr:helix-turn-helix domain-containing protein [Clostridia bacterium]
MKISDGVNKAIDLIEENLSNKNLDINFLAKELFLSPYYFQRAFCFAVQKSVGAYIRERRLTEAGTDIKLGAGILDTALKYGYDSQEAFSRAF